MYMAMQAGESGQAEVVEADIKHGVHSNWLTVERGVGHHDTPGTFRHELAASLHIVQKPPSCGCVLLFIK